MSLPVGTVVRLLGKQRTVGCLGNIYESIENLNDYYYMKSAATKVILLKPMVTTYTSNIALLLPSMQSSKVQIHQPLLV
ncbi:hypothetical protein Godav_024118 [Gossypium davidsonii]|uniref:Uncharacterized protein n=1 Tax=Gossypium davidsonii TaxID=34287 RepID=A0A7J8STY2_GOSDV|nr:hypothetical protein [Gossypium davidsonii]